MIRLCFLGQSGIRLQASGTTLYVDPFLSNYVAEIADEPDLWTRRFPPPIEPETISDATAVLCTHEHADHLDPLTLGPIAKASPAARFAVPAAAEEPVPKEISQERIDRTQGTGESFSYPPFKVLPVPAAHSVSYDVERSAKGHRWLGYVIEAEGLRIYHAGDTVRHQEQISAVQKCGALDLALLPTNGRDAYRDAMGLVGNLWPREAAEMAVELEAKAIVPLHHDVFQFNGISIGQLVDYVEHRQLPLEVRVLRAGGELELIASD